VESKTRLLAAPPPSRWAAALALGVVVVVAAACSSGAATSTTTTITAAPTASTGASAGGSGSAVVHVATVGPLGTGLVTRSGLTLYRYTPDGTGKSVCDGTCASQWPPLVVPAGTSHPAPGPGLTSADLGVIVRSDGSHQVTFKGMPLYTYSGDTRAGEATGEGLDETWYVVTPATAPPTTAPSSTPTTTASGGYGY
jgi:predicted lipoprotein with Yx(FWY)xxD motif